jgi:hypothetical protein
VYGKMRTTRGGSLGAYSVFVVVDVEQMCGCEVAVVYSVRVSIGGGDGPCLLSS